MSKSTIKILFYGLLALVIALLTIRNVFGTLETISEYFNIKSLLRENEYGHATINELRSELAAYNKKLKYISCPDTSNQSRLVNLISSFSIEHPVHIHYIPASTLDTSGAYPVETNIIQLEGNFKETLTLLYRIEKEAQLSKIVSLHFNVKEDISTHKKKLYSTVYFQNIYLP